MDTNNRAQMLATKRGLRFRAVQAAARRGYRELLKHDHLGYQTTEGKRIRQAAHQLMELADGEKDWVLDLKKSLHAWKLSGKRVYKIPVGYNRTQGGGPGHRGDMCCYGIRIEYLPPYYDSPARILVAFDCSLRAENIIGD